MKKLLITLEYPPQQGGIATYLESLVSQFKPEDIFVLTESEKNSFINDKFDQRIYRARLLSNKFWPRWLLAYSAAKKLIKLHQIEHIIISHLLPMGYVAILLKLPFTVVIHGLDILSARSKPYKAFFARQILKRATLIVTNSEYTKIQVLAEGIDPNKIITCYPCPKVRTKHIIFDQTMIQFKNQYPLLIGVGRLIERKGFDYVIKSLAILKLHNIFVNYLIIGNGSYQKKLEELINQLNLGSQIKILNNISESDLENIYFHADIFVMPNRTVNFIDVEGFGTVFLEAALHGLPAIAGNSGGAPEAVIHGKTGLIINPTDESEIADAIATMIENDQLRIELGEFAKRRASTEFTCENQFSKLVNLLS